MNILCLTVTTLSVTAAPSLDKLSISFQGLNEELLQSHTRVGAFSQYTKVEIIDGIIGLGSNCFNGYSSLQSINLASCVTYTKSNSFSKCSSLLSITLPDTFKSLGIGTFFNCYKLKIIQLSRSLEEIESTRATFQACNNLQKFVIEENPTFGTLLDGQVLVKDNSIMVGVAGAITSIEVPASIERIEEHVFSGRGNIKSITFAKDSSLKYISEGAFRYTSITSMVLPDKVETLCASIWEMTTSLTKVTLPRSLLNVSANVFSSAFNLETVGITSCAGVYSDEDGIVFNNENSVIFIPSDVKSFMIKNATLVIPSMAIQTKKMMKNLTVEDGNLKYYSRYNLLYSKNKTLNACPGGIEIALIDSDTVCIGFQAFSNTNVKNVTFLGTSVTKIETIAFYRAYSLSHIEFRENLKTIESGVFNSAGVDGFSVEFPSTLSKAENSMFYYSPVVKVDMSKCSKLTSIGSDFFHECKKLREVLFPSAMTSINHDSFMNNICLQKIEIPSGVQTIERGLFEGCSSLRTVTFIGANLTHIKSNAFKNCNLTSISLPKSVKSISAEAFNGNAYLESLGLTFDSELEEIGACAIQGCNSLKEFVIGSTFISLYPTALSRAMNLQSINVSSNNPFFQSIDGVLYNKNATYVIACPGGLESVSIKGNVTTFADSAFFGCSNLMSIDFESVPLSMISSSAFYGCSSLRSISIPGSVSQLQENSFNGCSALSEVSFQSGSQLEALGSSAFSGCTNLTRVIFEGSAILRRILPSAFAGCESLEEFTFPSSVEEIESSAFAGCSKLKCIDFVLNGSLRSIGQSSFSGCRTISKVTLPSSLRYLGMDSFRGCDNLKCVGYCGENDLSAFNAFFECELTVAYAPLSYQFEKIGGLNAFLLLDKDCTLPTAAFTHLSADNNMVLRISALQQLISKNDYNEYPFSCFFF